MVLLVAGSLTEQTSAMTPAGPIAQTISDLTWLMLGAFGSIFLIVILLLGFAIRAKQKQVPSVAPLGDSCFIVLGGIFIPVTILVGLLIHTLLITRTMDDGPSDALAIRLTGHMWWWDVRYLDSGIITANEIYIPIKTRVRIELQSKDVIHSLWVPSLAGKTDLLPGIQNTQWIEALQPGKYRGQCAEYCGLQHAWMALYVVALPVDEYQAWVKARMNVVVTPNETHLKRGLETFKRVGCSSCHTIQGIDATGTIGPDLTHMGSRLSIGAGKIENNLGNLMGWISNPQAIKPGNKMPITPMPSEDLQNLASYLMSLK